MTQVRLAIASGLVWLAASGVADSATCESLSALRLPNTTITMAQMVAAGSFVAPARGGGPGQPLADLPAFCRVQATIRPTTDSNIKIEVWLPAAPSWNGKLRGSGNGGLGGGAGVGAGALANGVRRGYATA